MAGSHLNLDTDFLSPISSDMSSPCSREQSQKKKASVYTKKDIPTLLDHITSLSKELGVNKLRVSFVQPGSTRLKKNEGPHYGVQERANVWWGLMATAASLLRIRYVAHQSSVKISPLIYSS